MWHQCKKCNISAKSVTPVQKVWHQCKKCNTSANCTSQFWVMIGWKTIWRKNVFSNGKKALRNWGLPALLQRNFFMFILLMSNHTDFLVQLGINLRSWSFQNAEITFAELASVISAFWKTHLCKLIPNWTRKPYDYLYLYIIIRTV